MMGNYKSSKKAINSLIIVLLWILFSNAQALENWRTCVIVIDGDTIVLDGNEIVRLIGIDTPETKDPRKPVQYYGREAYEFTKGLVYDLNKLNKKAA